MTKAGPRRVKLALYQAAEIARQWDPQLYLWADGLYLKAGLGDEKIAVLIVIGVTEDGQKELLAMGEGYRESTERRTALAISVACPATMAVLLRSRRSRGCVSVP